VPRAEARISTPRIQRVRAWLINYSIPMAVVAGTILGLALFIFPGHGDLNPANVLLATSCGVVFGVSWWAAARSYEAPEE
jgi:hypothetical protein